MADGIFSAARLRGYRLLEEAGVGDAVGLQVTNMLLAGQLWLPYSLIEIAFRNVVDTVVGDAHHAGADWLVASGKSGDSFHAPAVSCWPSFQIVRDDGSVHDPVAEAARAAAVHLTREHVSRDDLIAHLMFGFWVNRCPDALAADPGLDMYALVATALSVPLDDPRHLRKTMKNHVLPMRNRVAHHEPLVLRKRHLFLRGEPRTPADMVVAVLEGAIPTFRKEVATAVSTAKAMVPQATEHLDQVPLGIEAHLAPIEEQLRVAREGFRARREERMHDQRVAKGIIPSDTGAPSQEAGAPDEPRAIIPLGGAENLLESDFG